jgi:hypothetical protein
MAEDNRAEGQQSAVAFQRITCAEVERLGAARHPMMFMYVEELEFYAALDGWYLGVLLLDKSDRDYSFAVLGPDPKGAKRWIGGGDSVKSIDDARSRLTALLQRTASGGKRIHEQD